MSKQLMAEVREKLPVRPGSPEEVRRPLPPPGSMHGVDVRRAAGWLGTVAVTKRHTTLDWAKQVRALANLPRSRDAETITLVCDNLNTHSGDSFYAALPAAWAEARNRKQVGGDWQLSVDDARTKLKHLYPKIKTS